MNIVYVACAIRVAGDGIEQRGAQDIADLEAGVKDRHKPKPPQSMANGSHLTTAAPLARQPQCGSPPGLLLATLPHL